MNTEKQKTLTGFRKAQSLLKKIIDMAEKDSYCIDIMQQNLAVIGLLRAANQTLMQGHLNSCFRSAMAAKNEKRKTEMIEEILSVTKIFNR